MPTIFKPTADLKGIMKGKFWANQKRHVQITRASGSRCPNSSGPGFFQCWNSYLRFGFWSQDNLKPKHSMYGMVYLPTYLHLVIFFKANAGKYTTHWVLRKCIKGSFSKLVDQSRLDHKVNQRLCTKYHVIQGCPTYVHLGLADYFVHKSHI